MAKVMTPLMSGKASGRFMQMVFQAWRGLAVVREFEAPTQPHTARQMAVRAIFSAISKYWAGTLTEGLRIAWANFVFRWTDLWGNAVSLTGLNLFQKFNFILRDSGRNYQTTTPPPIAPSQITTTKSVTSEIVYQIVSIPMSEVTAQDTFVDCWLAGAGTVTEIAEEAEGTVITVSTQGMPQGVNPVKSNYKHLAYITQVVRTNNPQLAKTIEFHILPSPVEVFTTQQRISMIFRRYNKYGNYSAPVKESDITVPD
jgi:hypothetical protein